MPTLNFLAIALVASSTTLARPSVDEGTFGWHLSQVLYAHGACGIPTSDLGDAPAYYERWSSSHAKGTTPQKLTWRRDNEIAWALNAARLGGQAKVCAMIRGARPDVVQAAARDVAGLRNAHAAAQTAGH